MKLYSPNYTSPLPLQGMFDNVFIEDYCLTHKRSQKYISIGFEMYYQDKGEKFILATAEMGFLGMEDDLISSNKTTLISIPDIDNPGERIVLPFFAYLAEHGQLPSDYQIADYGFPTYEKVMEYFQGGTLESPEIIISDPFAIGFLMNSLVINGELVKKQFQFIQ